MEAIDKLNAAYEQHKDSFVGSFHSALWDIMVNEVFDGKVIALTSVYQKVGHQLGVAVANEAGYSPTPAYFKPELRRDQTNEVLESLNKTLFGLTPKEALRIVASSMAAGKVASK